MPSIRLRVGLCVWLLALPGGVAAQTAARAVATPSLPRTADGKPDLQGIWKAQGNAALDVQKQGALISYQPAMAAKRAENLANRKTADPLGKCYMPGVPRIMYLNHAFQIFQTPTHVAETFEWSQLHRLIYVNGSKPPAGIDFWMGDSRGRWDGDTLVVDVTNHNDRTWFDAVGNFHSDAMHVVERYTMQNSDMIQYEATIEDPAVFVRPWTIRLPFMRQKMLTRLPEYQCAVELEEKSGTFSREPRTWAPGR